MVPQNNCVSHEIAFHSIATTFQISAAHSLTHTAVATFLNIKVDSCCEGQVYLAFMGLYSMVCLPALPMQLLLHFTHTRHNIKYHTSDADPNLRIIINISHHILLLHTWVVRALCKQVIVYGWNGESGITSTPTTSPSCGRFTSTSLSQCWKNIKKRWTTTIYNLSFFILVNRGGISLFSA